MKVGELGTVIHETSRILEKRYGHRHHHHYPELDHQNHANCDICIPIITGFNIMMMIKVYQRTQWRRVSL